MCYETVHSMLAHRDVSRFDVLHQHVNMVAGYERVYETVVAA